PEGRQRRGRLRIRHALARRWLPDGSHERQSGGGKAVLPPTWRRPAVLPDRPDAELPLARRAPRWSPPDRLGHEREQQRQRPADWGGQGLSRELVAPAPVAVARDGSLIQSRLASRGPPGPRAGS